MAQALAGKQHPCVRGRPASLVLYTTLIMPRIPLSLLVGSGAMVLHGFASAASPPVSQAAPAAILAYHQDNPEAQFSYAVAARSTPASLSPGTSLAANLYEQNLPQDREGQLPARGKALRLNPRPAVELRSSETTRSNAIMARLWARSKATRLIFGLAVLMATGALIA